MILNRKLLLSSILSGGGRRPVYRHASGYGSVIEWIDLNNIPRKTLVLDAKYRNIDLPFGTYDIDLNLKDHTNVYSNTKGNNYIAGRYVKNRHNLTWVTDSTINKIWINSLDTNTSKQNCNIFAANNSWDIYTKVYGSPAVKFARAITVINPNGCDVPNINTLIRIKCEMFRIDALDPTVQNYPELALSSFTYFHSSTLYDKLAVLGISTINIGISHSYKNNKYGVVPILEI